ncbi:Autoinducer 2 sensor kinase/phosphatase LuxQ [Salinivirga cyanobacteriivorans]|uniref:histidine kinase n=1 Tax=Salinivirga cyanobacteriivorans TaxID=1307839 RepID=A0A0S2I5R0_9BACT|nr:response regulator [Salinivirga cyanobacteriivorans]ALO17509.1 Autoinducer 2 sensor kinase/phosphatase LuxQ [Salinivirga cyanobacteriivorans]
MNEKLKILIAEDLDSDAEFAIRELKKEFHDINTQVVDTEVGFKAALDKFEPDAVVSDYRMPSFNGLKALEITKKVKPFMAFVILTGSMNEDTAVECMKAGADDYVIKEHIRRLGPSLRAALRNKKIEREHYTAEQSLKESEERYRSLIEYSNDGILLLLSNQIILVNKKLEKIFGYTRQEIEQEDFDIMQLIAEESQQVLRQRFEKVLTGEPISSNYEFRGITKQGEQIELEASVSYIHTKDGVVTQAIIRDITEKNQDKRALIKAKEKAEESDKLKSAFLLNISHEVRTPLNGILGFVNLLTSTDIDESKKLLYAEQIKNSSYRLMNTITDIIELSRIETDQLQYKESKIDLEEFIHELHEEFKDKAEQKGLKWHANISEQLNYNIFTDREKLNQIMHYLLDNAIKYTNHGEVRIDCNVSDDNIEINVKDTGIGIHEDRQKAVFDRFVQADTSMSRDYEGTGLGLTISQGLAKLLDGDITVKSEKGQGSVFKLVLPCKTEAKTNVKQEIEKQNLDNVKIMIVDDEETSLMYLEVLLADSFNEILVAKNGFEAIELCKGNPDIDIILMDLKMPQMDGYTATQEIRSFNRDVVIIAQSAHAFDENIKKALDLGCDDYITKPVSHKRVLKKIEKFLN